VACVARAVIGVLKRRLRGRMRRMRQFIRACPHPPAGTFSGKREKGSIRSALARGRETQR
jgi:hypothetical protein